MKQWGHRYFALDLINSITKEHTSHVKLYLSLLRKQQNYIFNARRKQLRSKEEPGPDVIKRVSCTTLLSMNIY